MNASVEIAKVSVVEAFVDATLETFAQYCMRAFGTSVEVSMVFAETSMEDVYMENVKTCVDASMEVLRSSMLGRVEASTKSPLEITTEDRIIALECCERSYGSSGRSLESSGYYHEINYCFDLPTYTINNLCENFHCFHTLLLNRPSCRYPLVEASADLM